MVAVALIILFCVRVNMYVSKAKYVKTHTERHYQHGYLYYQNTSHSASNHGEGVALRKLIGHMHRKSSQTLRSGKYDQLVG